MKMSTNKALEAVLEELVLSEEKPTAATIEKWLNRYPQYRQDIIEFVSEWRLQDHLPDTSEGFDAAASAAASAVLGGIRTELQRRDDAKIPFRGIFAQAQQLGLRIETEAAGLGVNVQLLDLLDRKRVIADTVPEQFLGALAAKIQVSTRRLTNWLSEGSPAMVPSAQLGGHSFKAPAMLLSFENAWKQSALDPGSLKQWMKPLLRGK
jgi:small basic protein